MKFTKKILSALVCAGITLCTLAGSFPADISAQAAVGNTAVVSSAAYGAKAAKKDAPKLTYKTFTLADVPAYSGNAYTEINGNLPFFCKSELTKKSFEKYSELDDLGRCGVAYACVGIDLMPNNQNTKNHVLYRVTPMFSGKNLLAKGVLIEAYSVEDSGAGVCFNVFCYNVQPGISINYSDGSSKAIEVKPTVSTQTTTGTSKGGTTYILNANTKKFHYPSCSSVNQMSDKNKKTYTGDREDVIAQGYSPCKKCNP